MKLFLYTIFLAFVLTGSRCQPQTVVLKNNPTFDSVRVLPGSPALSDEIKMIVYISNENNKKEFTGLEFKKHNDTLNVFAESIEMSRNPTNLFFDTLRIGQLEPDDYKVFLINKRKMIFGSPEPEERSYTDTAFFKFNVSK